MISVSRATKQDLGAIRHLSAKYGHKLLIEECLFNSRDIAIQARSEEGVLVGFVWGGLMGSNQICYVDKVMVDPEFRGMGVLPGLYKELFRVALRRGVKKAFGVIRQDQFHDKSAKGAMHMAWGADSFPYTYVQADLAHMVKELDAHQVQEAHNGR